MRDGIKNIVIRTFDLERLDTRGAKPVQIGDKEIRPLIKYIWIIEIQYDIYIAGIYIFPNQSSGFEGLHANILWLQSFNELEPSQKSSS